MAKVLWCILFVDEFGGAMLWREQDLGMGKGVWGSI
jgi:hypothetical protein